MDAVEAAARPAVGACLGAEAVGEAGEAELGRFDWGYEWGEELAMLTAPATRAQVERLGWRLGTFADVAASDFRPNRASGERAMPM